MESSTLHTTIDFLRQEITAVGHSSLLYQSINDKRKKSFVDLAPSLGHCVALVDEGGVVGGRRVVGLGG